MPSMKKPAFQFSGVKVIQDKEGAAVTIEQTPERVEYLKSQFNLKCHGLITDLILNSSGEIEINFRRALNLAGMNEAIRNIKAVLG